MLFVLIVLLIWSVRLCFSTYWDAKNGRLKRNYQIGIKTRWTIASDETWEYIHRKYAFVFLGSGILVALMPVDVAVGMITTRDINNMDMIWWWILLGLAVLLVAWLVICGIIANLDARKHYLESQS
ncbi:SdpI family protein [Bifidobacterium biavatii]|uniref:Putative membrane spanning protein n=1 Tax=Bifidobacterium biavatii DSM 23969 TaxID=1437608 RepID=A0A086ZW87_9BIFI|nr:SdpI family protein [Bifidobacterium biavatii]KFI50787.1 putative membrane spanning protein [Bifidobacterium biavatii DSM 23969]